MSESQKRDSAAEAMEAEYQEALARWETAGRERGDAAADLIRLQTALKFAGGACIADPGCALDQAAADLALMRRAYCAALHSHHCAVEVLTRTREAFRFAQERLDCIALIETQKDMVDAQLPESLLP